MRCFIESLQCVDSHYCRSQTLRKYLPCHLNVKTLWRIYNKNTEDAQLKVKESLFRHIFNTEYNIRFGTPLTDACSKCMLLKEQLKREIDPGKRVQIITEKRVHSLRASAFYSLL